MQDSVNGVSTLTHQTRAGARKIPEHFFSFGLELKSMAGDWIKMRTNLDTDPRIIEIAASVGITELHVVGCLWKLWAWADSHSSDGNAIRVTDVTLDRFTGVTGFAVALRKVGWLEGRDGALTFPRFAEHNGQSAKKRCENKDRVAKHRNAKSVTDVTQNALPEKRREEKRRINQQQLGLPAAAGNDFSWLVLSQADLPEVCVSASKLRKARPSFDRDFVWQAAWIGFCIDRGWIGDKIAGMVGKEKPESWLRSALRRECEDRGYKLQECLQQVPQAPPVKEVSA